jgi:ornithine cyclodeaminase
MRETDAACFARSAVFVDTPEALQKSGDVLEAIRAGAFDTTRAQGTLAELCAGTRATRVSATHCTLFKSVGSALEDLAAAELVFDAVADAALSCNTSLNRPTP